MRSSIWENVLAGDLRGSAVSLLVGGILCSDAADTSVMHMINAMLKRLFNHRHRGWHEADHAAREGRQGCPGAHVSESLPAYMAPSALRFFRFCSQWV